MPADTYTPNGTSCWVDLDGPVHYVDHGGPDDAPVLVCVHGLGGSHANWTSFAPLLTDRYRVLALDLAGFGLTGGRPRDATVTGNRLLLHRFLTEVVGGPAVLIGNSMGGLIAAMQAAEHPETVSAITLVDPVLPLVFSLPDPLLVSTFATLSRPGAIWRALTGRRPPLTVAQAALRLQQLSCADPSRIAPAVAAEHEALARRRRSVPNTEADLQLAARSLAWAVVRRRQYAALLRGLRMPVLLIHGSHDRLVPIRAARLTAAANPDWRFEVATGVGHAPMLEAPVWTAGHVTDWLTGATVAAALKGRRTESQPTVAGSLIAALISPSTRSASSTGT
jgi:pimeloyl-ACP methyl ester carboxylesterase